MGDGDHFGAEGDWPEDRWDVRRSRLNHSSEGQQKMTEKIIVTFEEFIGNKKIEWEHDSKAYCPFCKSVEVSSPGFVCTLLGGTNPERINHYQHSCHCEKCGKNFVWEHKDGFQWYTITDNSIVVEGVHNCFEHYEYECQCGGMIKKEHRGLDGKTPLNSTILRYSFENGKSVPQQTTFWVCDKCKREIEYDY
jgi:hypothetical protein